MLVPFLFLAWLVMSKPWVTAEEVEQINERYKHSAILIFQENLKLRKTSKAVVKSNAVAAAVSTNGSESLPAEVTTTSASNVAPVLPTVIASENTEAATNNGVPLVTGIKQITVQSTSSRNSKSSVCVLL